MLSVPPPSPTPLRSPSQYTICATIVHHCWDRFLACFRQDLCRFLCGIVLVILLACTLLCCTSFYLHQEEFLALPLLGKEGFWLWFFGSVLFPRVSHGLVSLFEIVSWLTNNLRLKTIVQCFFSYQSSFGRLSHIFKPFLHLENDSKLKLLHHLLQLQT